MLKKGAFLVAAVLLLSLIAGSVSGFTVITNAAKDTISLEDVAEFDFTIVNDLGSEQNYRIVKLDYPYWDVYTKPLQNPLIITVGPNQSKTTRLLVDPMHVLSVGTVDVNIKVKRENSNESKVSSFRVSVVSADSLIQGYVPTVITNVEMPSEIDPRKEFLMKVRLDNQNNLEYGQLLVKLNSNSVNKEINEKLGPNEKKDIQLDMKIDPKTKPQNDVLIVTVYSGGKIIDGPRTINFKILSYSEISTKITPIAGFLRARKEITFTNHGNLRYDGLAKVETTPFRSLFSLTKPKGTVINEDGKKYIGWKVKLDPEESVSVAVSENYTFVLALIILAAIAVLAYCAYRSPLVIIKNASNIEKKEGGISEFKVVLTVRNRGNVLLRDIELFDRIPNIADIERELTIGTLQPVKVMKHEKKGSVIKWIVDDLGIGEERVIAYRIKSTLSIIGEFNLPSATAVFMLNDKRKTARSNSLAVSS